MKPATVEKSDSLQNLLDSIQSGVCMLNAEGTIVSTNRTWDERGFDHGQTRLGIGDNYISGRLRSESDDPEIVNHIIRAIAHVLSGELETVSQEYA
ncbi:MAG: hypothetical protein VX768_02410 [Planctomycetota bacterium]|nr:hypothetical protein [Planctomycetota bacterium]